MACSDEFIAYVCEQVGKAGEIIAKKMFGEYGLYCNGKIIGLVCENQLFLKPTKVGREILGKIREEPPYEGAKNYFLIENLEDTELLTTLIKEMEKELPEPKSKKKAL